LNDVIQLCRTAVPAESEETISKAQTKVLGFVYLIKFDSYYKIGRTNTTGRREKEIALELPEKTRLIHAIKTDDPSGIETYWHHRFEPQQTNGEWFKLKPADVAAFRRRRFM